ncbi:MAG: spermidine/putrescine ABC transporter substrate-binding protein [Magnetococcales bacterium]|nr:spermidine/putrescine ABC transporter substrate-binding protein [Magnetococcales bacterium]
MDQPRSGQVSEAMFNRRQVLMGGVGGVASMLLWPRSGLAKKKAKSDTLTLLIWPDYLDPGVIEAFEQQRGMKVKQVFFESDTERDQLLVKKGGDAFDLMVVNRINLPFYARQGWIAPVDRNRLKGLDRIDPRWIAEPDSAANLWGVPYFWGNIGLAYREDRLIAPPASWMDFFRPAEMLRGRIQAMESDRELIGMALKALGHSVNSEDGAALSAAETLLMEQKPHVKSFRYIELGPDSPLVTGEVWMAMVFNGDALKLREHHESIRYIQPREGSALWVDDLALGSNASGHELALDFLNFLLDPAMALRNAEALHFATPNREALRLASKGYLDNAAIFPGEELLQRSETVRPVSPRTQRRINDIVARLLK